MVRAIRYDVPNKRTIYFPGNHILLRYFLIAN